jgi:hypothetical protein
MPPPTGPSGSSESTAPLAIQSERTWLSIWSFTAMQKMAAYRIERTEGVGSSAKRFLSPATADATMSSPAGALILETAEEMPKKLPIARKAATF